MVNFALGLAAGSFIFCTLGIILVGLTAHELAKTRVRLQQIISFARLQDDEWTRRRMTGEDWNELVLVISPYENT